MDLLALINAGACIALCALLGWLIMAPTVSDGIIVKIGLILSTMGLLGVALVLLGSADPPGLRPVLAAMLLVHLGVIVAVAGIALRILRDPVAREVAHAISGWPPLDSHAPSGNR